MKHPMLYNPLEIGLFADNAALLAQGLEPERPTVAPVLDGACLLYRGRLNEVHAEPSVGKTNVGLVFASCLLQAGHTVVFIDPEDHARAALARLVAFGCPREAIIAGFKHSTCPDAEGYVALHTWARSAPPEFLICDGLAELLAALGLDENVPADFLKFCRQYLKPFTDLGICVLLSDHVVKNTETRSRWSRGTGAKLGKYDGISYSVELGKAYSQDIPGFVRLRVAKDRQGGLAPIGEVVAELHFTPTGNGRTQTEFRRPAGDGKSEFKPTVYMERISRYLEEHPEASSGALKTLGKAEYIYQAIEELKSIGCLEVIQNSPGRPTKYILLSPYPGPEPAEGEPN